MDNRWHGIERAAKWMIALDMWKAAKPALAVAIELVLTCQWLLLWGPAGICSEIPVRVKCDHRTIHFRAAGAGEACTATPSTHCYCRSNYFP